MIWKYFKSYSRLIKLIVSREDEYSSRLLTLKIETMYFVCNKYSWYCNNNCTYEDLKSKRVFVYGG
jgi:hypothetical protein